MRVLIIGGGGREHALAWKLGAILAGTDHCRRSRQRRHCHRRQDLQPGRRCRTPAALAAFAAAENIDLTVVGPGSPRWRMASWTSSRQPACAASARPAPPHGWRARVYAKDFMACHGIPTAAYALRRPRSGLHAPAHGGLSVVIKASGSPPARASSCRRTPVKRKLRSAASWSSAPSARQATRSSSRNAWLGRVVRARFQRRHAYRADARGAGPQGLRRRPRPNTGGMRAYARRWQRRSCWPRCSASCSRRWTACKPPARPTSACSTS